MKTPVRFIFFFCLYSILFISIVGLINYVVNPFLIFQHSYLEGTFNKKPESASRVRTFKKYQAENQKFECLIVGNSRVEMGLDPDSKFLSNSPTYNVGVPGLSVQAQIAYANNVITTNPIDTIFIGVDFVDFISRKAKKSKKYELNDERSEDYLAATLSLDALNASFLTIFTQNATASTRSIQGFNPANDYIPILENEGQEVLNLQKLNSLAKQLKSVHFFKNELLADENSSLKVLHHALHSWQKKGKRVIVFINPYQDLYYDELEKAGLIRDFEIWRKTMKETASETNSKFFDFTELGKSHSNLLNDDGKQAYFWEPAHYKKELGEKMLKVMTSSVYE